jgi:hypothetical protein
MVSTDRASAPLTVSAGMVRERRLALCAHLLRRQLGRILRLVDVEVRGQPVRPAAFTVDAAASEEVCAVPSPRTLRCASLAAYARNDPRFEVIHNGLRRALRMGRFGRNGRVLDVDGFRLRNLAQWAKHHVSTLSEYVGAISSYCNCDCEFCFQKGSRGAGIALGRTQLSLMEVDTRLRYYSADQGTGLPLAHCVSLEPFANPHCLDIWERLRQADPTEFLDFVTNGACLTEEVVARLAQLRPLFVSVSLNAATADLRRQSMRDGKPNGAETALASPALLRKYDIPFLGSYVPWPCRPLSDMEEFLRLLDRYDAASARIFLPSWTRFTWEEPPFDTWEYWAEAVEVVRRLRREVAIPIHVKPNMYELHTMRPVVQGTIKHSPAAESGIKYGDLIVAVEGEPVVTRPEVARWLTARFSDPDIRATKLTILRDEKQVDLELLHPEDIEALRYPYRYMAQRGTLRTWAGLLGFHLTDCFELGSFVRLKEVVEEYAGRRVLFFFSHLAEPLLAEGIAVLGGPAEFAGSTELHLERLWPESWGGNVMLGDLWTVQDVIEGAREWIDRHGLRPDVVIVPSTFLGRGGRDLVGRCYLEFERALDIELRLLRGRLMDL